MRTPVRAGDLDGVKAAILEALGHKPEDHCDIVGTDRKMSQIGG